MRELYNKYRSWILLTIAFAVIPLFFAQRSFLLTIFSLVLVYNIASLGLNLVIGYAGQISIGHGAFLAIGAYTSAILTVNLGVPFIIAFLISGVMAGLFGIGLGIPSLRLKGYYLAIATLAFGVMVEEVARSWQYIGGAVGFRNIPQASLFGITLSSELANLYFIAFISIVIFIVTDNILKSKTGRAMKAIRESAFAAQSLGINITKYKMIAFITSAVYAGLAGSLYAHTINYISPPDFGLGVSINLLAIIVIGGLATLSGGFIGSIIMVAFPFLLSRVEIPMSVIFGIMLIIVVLFFPRGIAYGIQLLSLKHLYRPYTALRKKLLKKKKEPGNYIQIHGKRIFYVEVNPQAEKTILFIHGNAGSWRWFRPALELLPKHYRGIALDMPGFGRSDKIEEISIEEYASFVGDFLEELGIEKVYLVAHSLGGAVAQKVLLDKPKTVEKVSLIDPAPPSGYTSPPEVYGAAPLMMRNRGILRKSIISTMPTRRIDALTEQLVDDALLMDSRCFTENARALEEYDYSDKLKGNETPLLVFLGRKDLIITEKMVRQFEELMPNTTLKIYEDCGHSINVEKPVIFTEELVRFLDSE